MENARVFEFLADGNAGAAIAVMMVLLLVEGLERWAFADRWSRYFRLGFPSSERLVPLRASPEGEVLDGPVCWKQGPDPGLILFWAGEDSGFPSRLRGAVWLSQDQRGAVHLDVSWAPSWMPLVALDCLLVLALWRQDAPAMIFVSFALAGIYLWVHYDAAHRMLGPLRYSLAQATEAHSSQGGSPS